MNDEIFHSDGAYMVHDLGPGRFHADPMKPLNWLHAAGAELMKAEMRSHGLTEADVYVGASNGRVARVATDAGGATLHADLPEARTTAEVRSLFRRVAAGVAQRRMAVLAGWTVDEELPLWSITISALLRDHLAGQRTTPSEIWNAGVNIFDDGSVHRPLLSGEADGFSSQDPRSALPEDSLLQRFATGMRFQWTDGDLSYSETDIGAVAHVPAAALLIAAADAAGRTFSEVVDGDGQLATALAPFRVIAIAPAGEAFAVLVAVPMTTVRPIPEPVLRKAGITAPESVSDRPLWLLTPPDVLLGYDPLARKAA